MQNYKVMYFKSEEYVKYVFSKEIFKGVGTHRIISLRETNCGCMAAFPFAKMSELVRTTGIRAYTHVLPLRAGGIWSMDSQTVIGGNTCVIHNAFPVVQPDLYYVGSNDLLHNGLTAADGNRKNRLYHVRRRPAKRN